MHIRHPRPEDADAIAALHVATWREGYAHLVPDTAYTPEVVANVHHRWALRIATSPQDTFVAETVEGLAGFVLIGPCRDPDLDTRTVLEIYGFYVLPRFWRRGIGRALMNEALAEVGRRGYREVALWVLRDNPRGRAAYESYGFRPDGSDTELLWMGIPLRQVRYRKMINNAQS